MATLDPVHSRWNLWHTPGQRPLAWSCLQMRFIRAVIVWLICLQHMAITHGADFVRESKVLGEREEDNPGSTTNPRWELLKHEGQQLDPIEEQQLAKLCMGIVDSDRLALAQEDGYAVQMTTLFPHGSSPKNNLLVGVAPS